MRGKGLSGLPPAGTAGITPAYAGKSCIHVIFCTFFQDHPRLCGEKCRRLRLCQRLQGSPPPMRGKVEDSDIALATEGITPAYAGKSAAHRHGFQLLWDHPRLCGEKHPAHGTDCRSLGSPPPMRGKESGLTRWEIGCRITPAYAGKS